MKKFFITVLIFSLFSTLSFADHVVVTPQGTAVVKHKYGHWHHRNWYWHNHHRWHRHHRYWHHH